MTKKFVLKPSPGPSEKEEQCALSRWLDARDILYCHCPNGEKRDLATAAKLKRMGVKRGVPDILIFTHPPDKTWAQVGVAIEMKTERGGRLSEHQSKWLAGLSMIGWHTKCCHGARDAIRWLQSMGY